MAKHKKIPEKGIPLVIDQVNLWKEFLIFNQYLPRIRHNRKESCIECGAQLNKFHFIGCGQEKCPHCQMKAFSCPCEGYKDEL